MVLAHPVPPAIRSERLLQPACPVPARRGRAVAEKVGLELDGAGDGSKETEVSKAGFMIGGGWGPWFERLRSGIGRGTAGRLVGRVRGRGASVCL